MTAALSINRKQRKRILELTELAAGTALKTENQHRHPHELYFSDIIRLLDRLSASSLQTVLCPPALTSKTQLMLMLTGDSLSTFTLS